MIPVPPVCHRAHDQLVYDHKHQVGYTGVVFESKYNVHGQVDEDLGEKVRTGHVLKQPTIWYQVLRVFNVTC